MEIDESFQIFKMGKYKKIEVFLRQLYAPLKIKFSIKDFFSKCDQFRRELRIRSHLLKKFLMENFIFCAVVERLCWVKLLQNWVGQSFIFHVVISAHCTF